MKICSETHKQKLLTQWNLKNAKLQEDNDPKKKHGI